MVESGQKWTNNGQNGLKMEKAHDINIGINRFEIVRSIHEHEQTTCGQNGPKVVKI